MKKTIITIISCLLGIALIGGSLFVAGVLPFNKEAASNSADPGTPISLTNLAKHDGLGNRDCYVAVDGTVYLIKGFALWEMGQHTPSNGKAKCGQDLSQVILESPHGKSKLQLLKIVGKLQR